MPEVLNPLQTGLSPIPDAPGPGEPFAPLPQDLKDGKVRAHTMQTILGDPQDLYKLWRDIKIAPRWQEFVVSVDEKSETLSHWVLGNPDEPDGKRIEYDSEIVEDVPGQIIAWKSVTEGVEEGGQVTFESTENGRGTLVTLQERIGVPGGSLGNAAAALSKRTPRQIVIEDLRHFKQLVEAGEIPSVVGQPHGPRGIIGGLKERTYGENNPTPPGTSDAR